MPPIEPHSSYVVDHITAFMWRPCLCGGQPLWQADFSVPFATTPHKCDRYHSQAAASSFTLGASTMFEQLFTRPRAVAHHSAGPLLAERISYRNAPQ